MRLIKELWSLLTGYSDRRHLGESRQSRPQRPSRPPDFRYKAISDPHARFIERLPLGFFVGSWHFALRLNSAGRVSMKISEALEPVEKSDPRSSESTAFSASQDLAEEFVREYLRSSVGMKVVASTWNAKVTFMRDMTIRHTFAAWLGQRGPLDKNGRLRKAMYCIGYAKDEYDSWFSCQNRTKNPSGRCHHHDGPDVKTLFNYETVTTYEQHEQWQEKYQTWADDRYRERNLQIEDERAQREKKWSPIASNLSYTATDRQIYFLLDLGVKPHDLEGIDRQQASIMIQDILDKME
jgi:hypothetical protein